MTLSEILYPFNLDEFITNYRGERHFIVKGAADKFRSLLSWDQLNEVLFTNRLEYPRFRLIKDGEVVDPSAFMDVTVDKRGGRISKVNLERLVTELRKGTAIHILSLQEFSKVLTDTCMNVSNELLTDVEMTLHVGMKGSRSFDIHWDAHDVIVIQLYGKKHWKVYGFTEKYPFRTGPSVKEDLKIDPIWEGDLIEGDLLYLPRGYWHLVQSYDEACMHISLGMYNPKVMDYISWITSMLTEFEFFRKDLSIDTREEILSFEVEQIRKQLNELITTKTYRGYLKKFIRTEKKKFELPNI